MCDKNDSSSSSNRLNDLIESSLEDSYETGDADRLDNANEVYGEPDSIED
jgi:hypothetical protein